ncbi:hypothetical protein D3C75_224500 [compost metagenome]
MQVINQLAQQLSSKLNIEVNKTHENAYQRVFKHKGDIDFNQAERDGLITIFKNGEVIKEFTLDEIRFVAVTSLNTITQAKAA